MKVEEFELLPMRPGWKYEYWEQEVERLEVIADRAGYEAVAPVMTWRK